MANDNLDRKFVIFNVSELNKINFNYVFEESVDTLRLSLDGTKTFVKWYGMMPSCIRFLSTKEGPYTQSEINEILLTPEWTDPNPPYGKFSN